jgi:plastocyanin
MRSALLLPIALVALACAREPAPAGTTAAAAAQQVTITATDFGYELPATPIAAGLTTVTLMNTGKELHHVQFYRLTEGKSVADFSAASQGEGPPPAWAIPEGGPNGVLPGQQVSATLNFQPGSYVMLCRIPSPDGVAHMMKGMVLGMEVQASGATAAALPAGDIQMGLFDYGFSMSQPITAGTHTFSVTNQAGQPHEVVVVQVPPGGSMDAWKDWISTGMQGPPPGAPFSGITDIAPGAVQNFTATFAPGTYGLICFVPDAGDGKPHLFHGMLTTFTVS